MSRPTKQTTRSNDEAISKNMCKNVWSRIWCELCHLFFFRKVVSVIWREGSCRDQQRSAGVSLVAMVRWLAFGKKQVGSFEEEGWRSFNPTTHSSIPIKTTAEPLKTQNCASRKKIKNKKVFFQPGRGGKVLFIRGPRTIDRFSRVQGGC